MPFTITSADLPQHVKDLPDKKKAQWVEVWNSAFAKCDDAGGKDCEATAFRQANGVVAEAYITDIEFLSVERDTGDIDPAWREETQGPWDERFTQLSETLELLREQAVMKTEDGEKFPAKAFAFVPDAEKPSTWKIRLWESPAKKVTRRQLGAAAAAFSPGGFRGQRVQIPTGDVAKVKAKVRAGYRSLGITDKNIPRSVKESESMSRLLGREMVQLEESAYDGDLGEVDVTIIRPGFNASRSRFYPADMLRRDKGIFEGLKMFADHPTPQEQRDKPERSVRGWVGSITNVTEGRDGEIRGRAKIVEPWFREKLGLLKQQGLLHEMGVSIVALGEGVKTTMEGTKTRLIERLVKGRSVDFVTFAGAGGQVECFESADHPEDLNDIELVDVDRLTETRPDLIEIIEAQTRAKLAKESSGMEEKDKEITELTEANKTLTTQNTELTAERDAQAATVAKAEIDHLIGEAKVPEAMKARLTGQFKDATSSDGVAEAIVAETAYLDTLKEKGVIKELGDDTEPNVTVEESEKQRTVCRENSVARYMDQGHSKEEAELMAANFMKGM